ncbi:MAG: hypothetical protein N4A71_25335 [Carboxylicivirga sp.]|jgi:hypothetical protein|nr:hypothetical protein [Carboxylicivirga sp.]MCT4645188.1 hypothetical protein [Carboxylicivirga sp.]
MKKVFFLLAIFTLTLGANAQIDHFETHFEDLGGGGSHGNNDRFESIAGTMVKVMYTVTNSGGVYKATNVYLRQYNTPLNGQKIAHTIVQSQSFYNADNRTIVLRINYRVDNSAVNLSGQWYTESYWESRKIIIKV